MVEVTAEEKKPQEVELDTDDVKEENVEVKQEEKKEEAPKLNLGEVDLGYTSHDKSEKKEKLPEGVEVQEEKVETKPEEKKEVKQEKPVDNLKEQSTNYQKRIDKLVYQVNEAKRRERAATDYAKGLQKKYDTTIKKYDALDQKNLKEFDARVDAQREQVKVSLKQAIEANDAQKIMEANDALTKLAVEKEKARLEIENREQQQKQQQNVEAKPKETPSEPPQITPKAKEWAEKNKWFGEDKIMTDAAVSIHQQVVQEGIEVDSDEYYNEVNSRIGKYFPSAFENTTKEEVKEQPKPVQTVASAGRKQHGRRTVKLTKSQVAIAKRLGVPLEEYAKYVKEEK
tara:strand:+ start:3048 stop:4073 length:1026 start_codon:yes stop_codon:yes gene_type:complete